MANTGTQNSAIVKIFGEEYPITGTSDPAEIARIADIVDSRIREIASASQIQARDKMAILAALSFASELSEYTRRYEGPNAKSSDRVTNLVNRLELALAD